LTLPVTAGNKLLLSLLSVGRIKPAGVTRQRVGPILIGVAPCAGGIPDKLLLLRRRRRLLLLGADLASLPHGLVNVPDLQIQCADPPSKNVHSPKNNLRYSMKRTEEKVKEGASDSACSVFVRVRACLCVCVRACVCMCVRARACVCGRAATSSTVLGAWAPEFTRDTGGKNPAV
jgi:hypothetical protein